MASSLHLSRLIHAPISSFPIPSPPKTLSSFPPLPKPISLRRRLFASSPKERVAGLRVAASAIGKLSDTDAVPVNPGPESGFPTGSGVYGVYDKEGELQFIGISRNVAASVHTHAKLLPQLCASVKVGLVDGDAPDRTVLTGAWKSWMEEHIAATGKVPPGNERGNNTWIQQPQKKPNLRLTPGRHVQLTVPLEDLIDRLVKEKEVVAFIKGTRSAPQCGFSQRVVGILESHSVDFECVDVLDEEYNPGLREKLKQYSNWPTFPQVFVKGELLGGCDIVSDMAEKGELAALFKK